MDRQINGTFEDTHSLVHNRRAYRAPSLVEYGLLDRLTLGSGGAMLDISVVDQGFINDTANCDAADQLTCFVSGSV